MAANRMSAFFTGAKSAADLSPASKLLGAHLREWDADTMTASFDFAAPPEFENARGGVQGGLIAAFLDEVMGAALYCASNATALPTTLDLNMSLIRPVPIGPLIGKGRAIKLGRRIAYLEGELFDSDGTLLARATSTAIPTPVAGAQ